MSVSDGYTRVWWVPTISNIASPTTAELNAGTALEALMPPDGWDPGLDDSSYTTSTLAGTVETEGVGRLKAAPKTKFFSDLFSDAQWALFAANPTGNLVSRRGIAVGTAWTSAQKVSVYPSQARVRKEKGTAENEKTQFGLDFVLTAAPAVSVAIA